jgi:predicted glycosyltransferase involved in capsule biosynthesis
MNNISFIFANYDRLKNDINSNYWLNTLIKQNNKSFRIIIVDSQSNDYDFLKNVVYKFSLNDIYCKLLTVNKMDIFNKSLLLNTGAKYSFDTHGEGIFIFGDVDISYNPIFVDKVIENYITYAQYSSRMFGPRMRTIRYFQNTFPPSNPLFTFEEILNANPRYKTWKHIPGGCQIVLSSTFFEVGGYNKYIPYCHEDSNFRHRCRGKFRREIKIDCDEPLIFHLPHEMGSYSNKSRELSIQIWHSQELDKSYDGCDTVEIFNVY